MPRDKDLKRVIRARMEKTGEAYTTARTHVLRKNTSRDPEAPPDPRPAERAEEEDAAAQAAPPDGGAPPSEAASDPAALAGMSDEKVLASTGRTWAGWAEALDAHGAAALPHGEIAALVQGKFGVGAWWSQMVTVGYERMRGLRERGQRRDGAWEANRSRTFAVPVGALFAAWAEEEQRSAWLNVPGVSLRSASPHRSLRLQWPDGTRVALWFTEKGPSKTSVSVQHLGIPGREAAAELKEAWGMRLDALAAWLAAR